MTVCVTKYATQSQLKCGLTVFLFKAAANKSHFSQCSDVLIMNRKLPSLLFIKLSVTAHELHGVESKWDVSQDISGERRR